MSYSGTLGAPNESVTAMKTSNYGVGANDSIIQVGTAANSGFTCALPTAVGISGKSYTFKDVQGNCGSEFITVDPYSSQTIDGQSTKLLNVGGESFTITSDGSNWITTGLFISTTGASAGGNGVIQRSDGAGGFVATGNATLDSDLTLSGGNLSLSTGTINVMGSATFGSTGSFSGTLTIGDVSSTGGSWDIHNITSASSIVSSSFSNGIMASWSGDSLSNFSTINATSFGGDSFTAGTATLASDATIGGLVSASMDSLLVREGSNCKVGIATLVAGTVTVSTNAVTSVSRIFVSINVPGGTLGAISVANISAGSSFDINSLSVLDTSQVAWFIVN